jgi:hypothetical protein
MTRHNGKNWEAGRRGFIPALEKAQKQELMLFWSQKDWKLPPARKWLKEQYGVELNPRTLGRYKKELKDTWDNSNTDADQPAVWENFAALAKQSVPTQHLGELRQMSEMMRHVVRAVISNFIEPTYRTLKWRGYVIEYHRETVKIPADQTYVAALYSFREIAHSYFGEPMKRNDLDEWLYYQPWEGGDKETDYLRDIDDRLIAPLQLVISSKVLKNLLVAGSVTETGDIDRENFQSDENISLASNLFRLTSLIQDSGKPLYSLPSQVNLEKVLRRWKKGVNP